MAAFSRTEFKNTTTTMAHTIRLDSSTVTRGIVAIDFGTSAIALAYSEINDKETEAITIIPWDDVHVVNGKNQNIVLLSNDGTFIRFGNAALRSYYSYSSSEDSSTDYSSSDDEYIIDQEKTNLKNYQLELLFYGYCRHTEREFKCVIPQEIIKLIYSYNPPYIAKIPKKLAKQNMLFESIKTALYNQNISDTIHCVDGRICSTSTVFVAIFKHIKQHVFQFFRMRDIPDNYTNEIQWILTVPAIWSDLAKHKMEKWALNGLLIDNSNHLRFVYETDCTLISSQHDIEHMLDGERCIVIDAGAGVVDIGCYQIEGKHAKEIYFPTGGLWGCNTIDAQFEQLLSEIFFDNESFSSFKVNHPAQYMTLINNFRKAKTTFFNKKSAGSNENFHGVSLPYDFIMEMVEYVIKWNGSDKMSDELKEFESFIADSRPFGFSKGHLRMEDDKLLISCEIWKKMFDEAINSIIDHVESLMKIINQIPDDKNNKLKNVKYLHVSGGFICSKYFQHRIRQVFGSNSAYDLQITIATRPELSTIDGAMQLARTPNYITARKLKYTYGIAVDRSEKNVDMSKLPKGYLDKYRRNIYIHPNTKKPVVKNLFSIIARKNSLIERNGYIEKQYRRFHKMENSLRLSLYCSEDMDPYVVGDKPLVSFTTIFPESYNKLRFKVRFYFGDTKLCARVAFIDGDTDQMISTDALKLKYE